MSPSRATVNVAIDASNASLEALIATYNMQRDVKGGTLQMANNYLVTKLLFLTIREGDRAMCPPSPIANVVVDASSVLQEVLIASLLPKSGIPKEVTFPMAIKLLIVVKSFSACADGERAMSPSCASDVGHGSSQDRVDEQEHD